MAVIIISGEIVLIDDAWEIPLKKWKWYLHSLKHASYVKGIHVETRKHAYMHRVIMGLPV